MASLTPATLVWMAGNLGSAGTVNPIAYTGPLQQSDLKVNQTSYMVAQGFNSKCYHKQGEAEQPFPSSLRSPIASLVLHSTVRVARGHPQ